MDLGTMLRVMIKRWYVSVPALLMAIALPVVAWFAVPAKYSSTSTISLLNSSAAANAGGKGTGNPFTSFDNSLTGAADYLARTLNSDQSMADMAKVGVTDLASAELAPNASGPFIILTITGKDPQKILTEMDAFDKYADQKMLQIQTQYVAKPLPSDVLVRTIVMVPPQKPVTSMKSRLEDVAGAGVGGMVVLFVAVFGTEALAIRRGKPSVLPARGASRRRVVDVGDEDELIDVGEDSYLAPVEEEPEFAPRRVSRSRPASGSRPTRGAGSLAKRAPSGAPTPLETTVNLPRYREPDLPDEEAEAEPWTDLDPVSLEDFAVGDRDAGSR
ncbi:MAG: hypothetical protein HOW97_05260 [Catenulispora sp.]|nr:hypothetical protein [Catenulispora sp.]